jgi:hypothetical protein
MVQKYTKRDVLAEAARLKNWGRWGPDDEIGALNFVTPADIVAAARLVRRGRVFRSACRSTRKGPRRASGAAAGTRSTPCDTWGIEVRPNETDELGQPLHWVTIPAIGVTHGEMFFLKDLAADCAADHTYEFFFAAPPLNITHGTGSPINPLAIK